MVEYHTSSCHQGEVEVPDIDFQLYKSQNEGYTQNLSEHENYQTALQFIREK
jgi:hypothetical protein